MGIKAEDVSLDIILYDEPAVTATGTSKPAGEGVVRVRGKIIDKVVIWESKMYPGTYSLQYSSSDPTTRVYYNFRKAERVCKNGALRYLINGGRTSDKQKVDGFGVYKLRIPMVGFAQPTTDKVTVFGRTAIKITMQYDSRYVPKVPKEFILEDPTVFTSEQGLDALHLNNVEEFKNLVTLFEGA